jgi:EmrB/QacA subfamily drug resistance transporter
MNDYKVRDASAQSQLMLIVSSSVFMFSLDYSMLNISLPTIAGYFGVPIGVASKLPLVYLLIATSTMLGFGKLGDMKGHKKIFIAGLAVFLAGAALCSVSAGVGPMIIFRAFQSLGEAMFATSGIAIITTFLPDDRKGRGLGFIALSQGLGLMLGNVAGGLINSYFTWRGIFLVNMPLCLLTIWAALRYLPAEQPKSADKSFDYPGAILVFIFISTLIYAINTAGRWPASAGAAAICSAVSAVALVLFVLREKRAPFPLLDLGLFRNRDFSMASLSAFFVVSMLIGMSFIAPFLMQFVRELPVMTTGVFLMMPSFMMLVLAPVAGRFADRHGSRALCCAGASLESAAFVMCSYINNSTGYIYMAACMVIMGIGAGMFVAPNSRLIMSHVPNEKQGVASGAYKVFVSVGSALGIAVLPIIIMNRVRVEAAIRNVALAEARARPELLYPGFNAAFLFAAAVSLAALVCAVLARDRSDNAAKGAFCDKLGP